MHPFRARATARRALQLFFLILAVGSAGAANVPPGITGLWRFQSSDDKLMSTMGMDLTSSHPDNSFWFSGPWTMIGIAANAGLFADGGCVQERSFDYLTLNPSFAPNGGGEYVNEYTVAIDYVQTSGATATNSLFQTAFNGNDNDGDLWTDGAGHIGGDTVGYSTLTYDASTWHRIVWSVANGNFFRVYVDGVLFLEGTPQAVDGRMSLYPDRFHLFADNMWRDQWGLVGTVAVWNRALTSDEVAGMGGWIGAATMPTELFFDPTTTNTTPIVTGVLPADGATNVAPRVFYRAAIIDSSTASVDRSSIQLLLDGAPVQPVIMGQIGLYYVQLSTDALLDGGNHKYTLTFNTAGVVSSVTNEVTFHVQDYNSYEWRFTNGDLSASVGTGVMSYADPLTTPGLTSFGTTDGTTVPHINGTPAKYMHVPAFTLNTDGYLLEFTESAPNVSGGNYINQYTVLMDVLVPGPLDWTPFFNTDPYNVNDADFWLAGDGSIGIGGGYSAPGTIVPGAWYRIAFVADLKANTLTYYVNGTNVKSRLSDGSDGRWSLYSNQDLGPDMLLFGEPSGQDTHELYVSSVAFTDLVLTPAEIAALGGPNASGIFVPGPVARPSLAITPTTGGALISWPQSYAGYQLQQADNLTTPQWQAVAGVVNNSVTVPTEGTAKFFRLMK